MKIDPIIKQQIKNVTDQVQELLPSAHEISKEKARLIIEKYTAAIQGNFVNWMAAAAVSARSVEGRFAAEENIYVEMKEDHPTMLRNFAHAAQAEPELKSYQLVNESVTKVSKIVSKMSGAENLTLMALLENTSAVFIPFLADRAKQLGSTNFIYTNVHGEADVEHADQFLWALTHEKEHYPDFDRRMKETIEVTLKMLKEIFT